MCGYFRKKNYCLTNNSQVSEIQQNPTNNSQISEMQQNITVIKRNLDNLKESVEIMKGAIIGAADISGFNPNLTSKQQKEIHKLYETAQNVNTNEIPDYLRNENTTGADRVASQFNNLNGSGTSQLFREMANSGLTLPIIGLVIFGLFKGGKWRTASWSIIGAVIGGPAIEIFMKRMGRWNNFSSEIQEAIKDGKSENPKIDRIRINNEKLDKLAQEKERIEKTPEDMRTPDQMDRLKKINKEMNDLKTENEKLDKEFTEEQAKKVEIENKIPPLIKKAKDFLNKNDEKFINDERKSIEAIIRDLEDVTSDKDKENLIGKLEELMKTIQERINAKPATPESVKKLLTDSNLDITTITDELELEKVIKTIEEYNKLGDEDKKLINIDINKLKEVEKVSEMIKKLKGNSLFTNALASKLIPAFLSLKNMKEVDISIDKDVVIQIKGDESKYYREAVRIMKGKRGDNYENQTVGQYLGLNQVELTEKETKESEIIPNLAKLLSPDDSKIRSFQGLTDYNQMYNEITNVNLDNFKDQGEWEKYIDNLLNSNEFKNKTENEKKVIRENLEKFKVQVNEEMNKYVNEIDTEVEKIENEKDDATNITVSILGDEYECADKKEALLLIYATKLALQKANENFLGNLIFNYQNLWYLVDPIGGAIGGIAEGITDYSIGDGNIGGFIGLAVTAATLIGLNRFGINPFPIAYTTRGIWRKTGDQGNQILLKKFDWYAGKTRIDGGLFDSIDKNKIFYDPMDNNFKDFDSYEKIEEAYRQEKNIGKDSHGKPNPLTEHQKTEIRERFDIARVTRIYEIIDGAKKHFPGNDTKLDAIIDNIKKERVFREETFFRDIVKATVPQTLWRKFQKFTMGEVVDWNGEKWKFEGYKEYISDKLQNKSLILRDSIFGNTRIGTYNVLPEKTLDKLEVSDFEKIIELRVNADITIDKGDIATKIDEIKAELATFLTEAKSIGIHKMQVNAVNYIIGEILQGKTYVELKQTMNGSTLTSSNTDLYNGVNKSIDVKKLEAGKINDIITRITSTIPPVLTADELRDLTERLKESVNVIKNDKELERVFITELPDWETKLTTAENNVKTMETDVRLNEELDNIKKMTDLEEQLKEIRKFEKINPGKFSTGIEIIKGDIMTAKLTEITLESDILERRKALDEFSKNFKLELTTFTTQKAEFDKIINKTAVLEIGGKKYAAETTEAQLEEIVRYEKLNELILKLNELNLASTTPKRKDKLNEEIDIIRSEIGNSNDLIKINDEIKICTKIITNNSGKTVDEFKKEIKFKRR